MKIDILAFGAHPDDVELSCSGTLARYKAQGKSIGIIDLTKGELGTRGTIDTRHQEATDAAIILDLSVRENLDLGDGWFDLSKENKLAVVKVIRKYQPTIVLANAIRDRHPDHSKGAQLLKDAFFLSGLSKIETSYDGKNQEAYRPDYLFHYIQSNFITPDFIVDITGFMETKLKSVRAYKTQFFNPDSSEPETYISSKRFTEFIEARSREMGAAINCDFGEGFTYSNPLPYDLNSLL